MTKRSLILAGVLIMLIILLLFFNKSKNNVHGEGLVPVESNTFKTSTGFGYNILVNHKLFIHQEYIPAVQGKKGFINREDAQKIADFVVRKIVDSRQPFVTIAEIDSLKIRY